MFEASDVNVFYVENQKIALMVAVQSFEAALCFLSCALATLHVKFHDITAFFIEIRDSN